MAESSYFLLVATFLPLLSSPVSYILAKKSGVTATTWFSFGVLAISTGLIFIPAMTLTSGQSAYVESYPWSQFGNFGLRLDGLSLPFALIIYILCTVLALYSKPYMIHKILEDAESHARGEQHSSGLSNRRISGGIGDHGGSGTYYSDSTKMEVGSQVSSVIDTKKYLNSQMGIYFALYLAFSMGMLGTVLATNLIQFYVYGARRRIALMFFFWTHVGAVVLLLALLSMGFFAGGFDFDTIRANASQIPVQWMSIIVFALVVGLGVKLAALLLHIWLPYAHAEAPTPVSALLSPAMIGIGAYGLLRLWLELLTGNYTQFSIYINIWGLATMIYGGAMALMQDDVKKVLAYSSISQMGYILFGLGSESVLGI